MLADWLNEAPEKAVNRAEEFELAVKKKFIDEPGQMKLLIVVDKLKLKELVPTLLEKWQRRLGVRVDGWGVKRMKTKWGSCTIDARRAWFNLELAKKPARCVEYLVVHEVMHLRERRHGDAFIALMDKALPSWRQRRAELNRAPLGHETWEY
jgi:predicted metal-dependent hydrolase